MSRYHYFLGPVYNKRNLKAVIKWLDKSKSTFIAAGFSEYRALVSEVIEGAFEDSPVWSKSVSKYYMGLVPTLQTSDSHIRVRSMTYKIMKDYFGKCASWIAEHRYRRLKEWTEGRREQEKYEKVNGRLTRWMTEDIRDANAMYRWGDPEEDAKVDE